ncbi:ATP-binding protein [uncultured Tateyamaria sp.]|uniref:ATP-binding protein n=1 Tax=uncultured Tateyamaria sp. TaxID=455651 RepID=UPI002628C695|nr:ATP-binding protein [uncultured Tateyamaria sp.]
MASSNSFQAGAVAGLFRSIAGDTPALKGLPEDTLARVRARQVYAISRLTIPMMLANIVNAFALLIVMEVSGQSSMAVILWALSAVLFALYTSFVWYRRQSAPFPVKIGRRTTRKAVRNAALLGAIWVIPGLFFLPNATGLAQSFLIALAAGMIAGGAMALYPLPAAALAYSSVISIGSFVGFSATGSATMIGFAMVTMAFFFIVATTVRRHSDVFVSEFVGRLELDKKNILIEQLLEEVQTQASDERIKSERRLAQAQKMEAIGQLTGGIAHDFNNLLAAIQGHAELIELEGKADGSLTKPILRSTKRGSDLVRELLSIARKQPLKSQSIDVSKMIDTMAPLLSRTLGGRIEIRQHVPVDLWHAHADLVHLEGAILNLALNARDAMPNGGSLTLECMNSSSNASNVLRMIDGASGQFVCVAIRDTGHGMSEDVRRRASQPFFTTKKFGDGSGLGLSTVEGFCGQSGGHLWIQSQEGVGTTIYMFLPRGKDVSQEEEQIPEAVDTVAQGNQEHVLVVEDDEEVRGLTTTMLHGLNYRTTWARTADEALKLVQAGSGFDFALIDVRLPGVLNGLEFAEILRRDFDDLPIVVYSGYPEVDNGLSGHFEIPFLKKPFSRHELAHAVSSTLKISRRLSGRSSIE